MGPKLVADGRRAACPSVSRAPAPAPHPRTHQPRAVEHTQLVVSLDGASRIQAGEVAEISVDGTKIHLFDPSSGDNLTVDRDHAGRITVQRKEAAEQSSAVG